MLFCKKEEEEEEWDLQMKTKSDWTAEYGESAHGERSYHCSFGGEWRSTKHEREKGGAQPLGHMGR